MSFTGSLCMMLMGRTCVGLGVTDQEMGSSICQEGLLS
eukprot:CAMPEP_0169460114 /NCGR_PEP_ID=MMETSP1042-20121227/18306_1 /TAXON_ID=464988 /ORGANISM="Hemiselmis andersenii, Strain CCMP1180" /LENGTH=37 /DNA_ID= /DNA_START= /DNA_END= /DNA_ORIENTATION=